MDKPIHKKEKPKLNVGFGIGLGEYSTSVVVGIVSAILTAGKTIRDKFYDDIKHAEDFAEHWNQQAQALKNTTIPTHDSEEAPTREEFKKFGEDIRLAKKTWADKLDKKILEDRGVRKSLIEGTIDRAKTMSQRSVNGILLNATIGAAVGAVMTLGFFNGIATRAKINAIDNAVEPEATQPPQMKAKPYKDRDALDTAAVKEEHLKTDKSSKHTDKLAAQTTPNAMSVTR